ncbi:MAG: type II secretion system protein N [Gammaproteobacteria bacterium]|nr:type II secretion system protein N [Gammaproteobacteria bacterium]
MSIATWYWTRVCSYMRKKLGFGIFFLLCLSIALLLTMPLVHPLAYLKIPHKIRLNGLDGTISSGYIDQLSIDRVLFSNINYQLDASCLLSLRICYRLDFDQGKGLVSAALLDQNLVLSNFQVLYPLENLSTYADKFLLQPSGNLALDIASLTFDQQSLSQIDAQAVWQSAGVSGEPINLGDYELMVVSEEQAYRFELRDQKALLSVDGKGLLKPNGQYTLNISIESQPGLEPQIKTALEFIAKKQGLNQYQIRRTGKLSNQMLSRLSFTE